MNSTRFVLEQDNFLSITNIQRCLKRASSYLQAYYPFGTTFAKSIDDAHGNYATNNNINSQQDRMDHIGYNMIRKASKETKTHRCMVDMYIRYIYITLKENR